MNTPLTVCAVFTILLSACTTADHAKSDQPYLGLDEARSFDADIDANFAAQRSKRLRRYHSISEVRLADSNVLQMPAEKRLFVVHKGIFEYFCIETISEIGVSIPSATDPNEIEVSEIWVSALHRYKETEPSRTTDAQLKPMEK